MATVDLNDLGVFAMVVEAASFSGAASRLGLPKSSVSRAIARLEEAVGVRVLHRTTRKVAASTAGRALYEKVRGDIASLRHAVGELPELEEEPSGRLRVTAPLACEDFLAEVVSRFVGRYRGVEVELRLANQYIDLVAEGIDLALRFATKRMKDSSLVARRLGTSWMHLFASPSYLAREGTPRTPKDLDRHEWIVYSHKRDLPLEGGGRPVTVVTRGRVTCNDFAFLRAAMVNGTGIGYLPPRYADADVAAGRLVRILPKWSSPVSSLWAVWPGGRQPPRKLTAFLALAVESLTLMPSL